MGCYKITKPDIKKNKYEKNTAKKLSETELSPDVELEWDNFKTVINNVAYDDVGTRINTKNAGWFDEDCRKAVKVKNEVRKRCIIRDPRKNKWKEEMKLERSVKRRKDKW
jgi:hypothetical protein